MSDESKAQQAEQAGWIPPRPAEIDIVIPLQVFPMQ